MMIRKSIIIILSAILEKQNPYQNTYVYFYHITIIILMQKF